VRIRRPERAAAALLLTALGASLSLLAHPSGSASAAGDFNLRASVRYGCAQGPADDSFVEVSLSAVQQGSDAEAPLVLQVGLAGPESTDSYGVFPEGGPSLVTLGDNTTKVRLAGPVHDGDHVFIRQVGQADIVTLPLQSSCRPITQTDFGLAKPDVSVQPQACTTGSKANLKVTLDNPNDVDRTLEKIGINQIDYTVLLVRQDGLLAGTKPVGTLVSFDQPDTEAVQLSQVAVIPTSYQVRVISLDGAVVSSDNIKLSCAGFGRPGGPSPSLPPPVSSTPAPPATSTPPASSSHPVPSSSHPVPSSSHPVPSSSAPSSSPTATSAEPSQTPSSVPTSSASASRSLGSTGSTQSAPVQPPGSSAVGPPEAGSTSGSASSGSATTGSAPASGRGSSVPSANPSVSPSDSSSGIARLVEPPTKSGGIMVFQKDMALVVVAFAVAIAALVGGTVVSARRR
jgi:hypothetical protein